MKYAINPFHSVGNFVFNQTQNEIRTKVQAELKKSYEEVSHNQTFVIDEYDGILAYYNKSDRKLFYILFVPNKSVELLLNDTELFTISSEAIYTLLKQYDKNIIVEDYVGFGSTGLGIDIYSPNYTEDRSVKCEAISVAIKGYFDCIYSGTDLNIAYLQSKQ